MNKWWFFFLLLFFSCSHISQMQVTQGNTAIIGGVYQDKQWNDSFHLHRVSWYQQVNMFYEALFNRFDLKSPFAWWLSDSEKQIISQCPNFLIAMTYSLDTRRISHPQFLEQMRSQGFEVNYLPQFAENLSSHPEIERGNFKDYNIYGFCSADKNKKQLEISFPGFKQALISI